jgi:hypothetical protein
VRALRRDAGRRVGELQLTYPFIALLRHCSLGLVVRCDAKKYGERGKESRGRGSEGVKKDCPRNRRKVEGERAQVVCQAVVRSWAARGGLATSPAILGVSISSRDGATAVLKC